MITILLCITYLATLTFLYFYNQGIAKERQQLYDRIHARNFIEYKQMTEPVESKPKEEKEQSYYEL